MKLLTREDILRHVVERHGRYNAYEVLNAMFLFDNVTGSYIAADIADVNMDEMREINYQFDDKLAHLPTDSVDQHTAFFAEVLSKVPDSALWVVRENLRFALGDYEHPLFVKQIRRLSFSLKQDLWWHFPHVSVNNPAMISYTQTRDKGQRDIQTPIKVGRYLQQFYGDVLTENQIRMMANGVKSYELHWATTAADMQHVYVNGGIYSCMSDSFSHFGDVHPVHVYDFEGQFKLGYLKDKLFNNKIVARGFVHEPSKTWVRVYGNEADSLKDTFNELGYERADGWVDAYVAAVKNGEYEYVMPYIDGDNHHVTSDRFNGKSCFRIGYDGDHYAHNTHGYLEEPASRHTCGSCGGSVDEDDMYWSDYHDMHIGGCCIDDYEHAYTCRGHHDWVESDSCVLNESNNEYYEQDYAREVLCETSDGSWYDMDDVVELDNGDYVYVDDAMEIDDKRFARTDCDVALDVVYCVNPSMLLPGQECVDFIDNIDLDNEPKMVDDYGNEMLVNWRSLRDLMRLAGVNDDYRAEVARTFNKHTGFAIRGHMIPVSLI